MPDAVPFSKLFVEFDRSLPAKGRLADEPPAAPLERGTACMDSDDVLPVAVPGALCAKAHELAATIATDERNNFNVVRDI